MTILKFVFVLLILMLNQSCKKNVLSIEYLVGEWISEDNKRVAFSFKDDKCSYFHPLGNFADYKVEENRIVISDTVKYKKRVNAKSIIFHIEELTKDRLVLIADPLSLKNEFGSDKNAKYDTLRLTKLKEKHSNEFDTIKFQSTGCYGSCPTMKIDIKSDGNFKYEGRAYTEKNGYYSGKLSKTQISVLASKLNYINLDSLKSNYSAMWTDDETCILEISTKDKQYKTRVYGFNEEPIELRIMFNELRELYKRSDMKQDSVHQFYPDEY